MNAVTEDQAQKMWCPTQTGSPIALGCCVGRRCMAWRWEVEADGEAVYERIPLGGGHHDNAPVGYCGLAGRPTP